MNPFNQKFKQLKNELPSNEGYHNSISSLENLLNQIDFNSEVVPIDDFQKLHNVFIDIKGTSLTTSEAEVVKRLITS